MTDVTFRSRIEQPEPKNENIVGKEVQTSTHNEEVPYTGYRAEHGKPFLADHYALGNSWEVFSSELGVIEDYVGRKIDSGEITNSVNAVKDVLKKMEKLHDLVKEERTVIKIGLIASYIKFLNETEGIKTNWRKYANS